MNTWHESRCCWTHRGKASSRISTFYQPKNLPMTKILTMDNLAQVQSQWAIKYRSWLLYIPAGLIEIYPHMKYQLPTINRSWDSTLAKDLNLVFWQMDGCTCTHIWKIRTLYLPGRPRLCRHKNDEKGYFLELGSAKHRYCLGQEKYIFCSKRSSFQVIMENQRTSGPVSLTWLLRIC